MFVRIKKSSTFAAQFGKDDYPHRPKQKGQRWGTTSEE